MAKKFRPKITKKQRQERDKLQTQNLITKERIQKCICFENQDLKENLGMLYSEFCAKYQSINGKPDMPYFTNGYKTPNITRQGFEIHHIGENKIANLSDPIWAFLDSLQCPDMLVYLTPMQHTIAHLLIMFENPDTKLGQGGLFNFGMMKRALHQLSQKDQELLLYLTEKYIPNVRNKVVSQQAFKPYVEKTLTQILDEYPILINNTKDGQDNYFSPDEWKALGLNDYYKNRSYTRIVRRYNDTLLVYSMGKEGYLLWNGTQGNNKTYKSIPEGIEFAEILAAYKWFCETIDKVLEPISQTVKQYGGTGNKHGLIVDVDDYNKIAVDVENKILNPYYAATKFEHTPYPSCAELFMSCQSKQIDATTQKQLQYPASTGAHSEMDLMLIMAQYKQQQDEIIDRIKNNNPKLNTEQQRAIQLAVQSTSLPDIPGGKQMLTDTQLEMVQSHDYIKDMYNRNNKVLRIQASVETNTIKTLEWDVVEMYRNFCSQDAGAVLPM